MCDAWDLNCQTKEAVIDAAGAVTDSMLGHLAAMINDAQTAVITSTVTWWLYLPPTNVESAPAAQALQQWMLPFALLVAAGGIMWQSLMLIINRKGEALVTVVKGLFTTAVWGAVSLTGTQLLLKACESYTEWVLTSGLNCQPGIGQDTACKTDALAERMQLMLAPLPPGLSSILVIVVGFLVLMASITQALLLLFRNGAIIILAGLLQLAASGSFTAATSNWLRRVLGWLLALVFYEPFAATSYAVAFMLTGDRANKDVATWFTGASMLGLSLISLPAMMRFFNWTVGAVQQSGNSTGMLAAAGAAGLHAMASHRGASGMSATDYARDMDRRSPPPSGGTGDGGRGGSGPPRPTPPTFTGPSPTAPAATPATKTASTASTASSASTRATTAAAASTGAGAGAASAGAAGAGAVGASAAAGPAAPVVAGVAVAAKATGAAVRTGSAMVARSAEET